MASEEDLILNIIERTTGDGLREGADDLDHVAGSADHAGGSLRRMGEDSGFVDSEIARLRTHIRDLGAEMNRTGNTDLFKDIKTDKSQLRQFENLAKMLTPAGEEGGKAFNKGFLSTIGELGSNLRGAMIPAAIGVGAVIAPMIGASIAGAVVGGVGLAGIAGGIAMASQDNAVRQSARLFGQDISQEFFSGGQTFVAPIIESLDILRDAFRDLDLGSALAPLAAVLPTLAEGISQFALQAMPGLRAAFEASGPAIEVLAQMLPQLGQSFGNMFAVIATNEGTLTGLRTLLAAVQVTFEAIGTTISFLTSAWQEFLTTLAQTTGDLEDIGGPLQGVMSTLNDGLENLLGIGPQIDGAFAPIPGRFSAMGSTSREAAGGTQTLTMSIDDLKRALDELFDKQMSYDQAILAIKTDTFALKKAVDDHGTSLSNNSQAGLDNQRMILGLIGDYERQRDASIKLGTSTATATRKFDDQVGALGGLLSKLGFTKDEVNKLLGAYKKLHDAPNIQKEIRINVTTSGATGALSLIGNKGMVASAFAEGGWVSGPIGAPQVAIVHGGEFVLSHDMLKASAMPATRPPQMMSPAGGGRIELVVRSAGDAASEFIGEMVQRFVYVRGGDPTSALRSG